MAVAWQAVSDGFRVGVAFLDSLVGGIIKVTIKVRSIVEPVMLATALGLHLRISNIHRTRHQMNARRRSRYFIPVSLAAEPRSNKSVTAI